MRPQAEKHYSGALHMLKDIQEKQTWPAPTVLALQPLPQPISTNQNTEKSIGFLKAFLSTSSKKKKSPEMMCNSHMPSLF